MTETKVPLKEGLDLQGGIHLALEVDQSKGTVADPKEAINRALTVIRTRIDEFGRNPGSKIDLSDDEIEKAIEEIRSAIEKYNPKK